MYLCPNAPGFPRGLLFGFRAPDDFDARYKAYGRHGCLRGKQCKQRGDSEGPSQPLRILSLAWLPALLLSLPAKVPAQVFTEYAIPTTSSQPFAVTPGPDGALWFTEMHGNNIRRITTGGAVTEYRIPTPASKPVWIVAGPDGALWFTEMNGN